MSKPALEDLERQLRPLWLSAQAGDESAYRKALQLRAARLRGYLSLRLSTSVHDVEDLAQKTLLALHLQRGTYDNTVPAKAWLYGIARHKLIDQLRRRGRREQMFEALDDLPDALGPVCTVDATASRDLGLLLKTLPAVQMQAILDRKLEGLSVADAARRGGVFESALKVRVHRGLKRLAQLIKEM